MLEDCNFGTLGGAAHSVLAMAEAIDARGMIWHDAPGFSPRHSSKRNIKERRSNLASRQRGFPQTLACSPSIDAKADAASIVVAATIL